MAAPVEARSLRKTYGVRHAVDGIDLDVRPGEVFSLLGPNGAGKTTTVEILEGLRARTGGEARVLGLDPWTEMDELRDRIGVVPQDFHFFPRLTPREALRLYASLFRASTDLEEILRSVELTEKGDDYFETLSGGEQRKVGVALALVNGPEVCFLDEPTTGLDPRARRSIWEVIRRMRAEGRSVLLTTHYLDEAQQLADRIAIIDHGRIVASGSPDEIIERFGRPARLRIVAGDDLGPVLQPFDGSVARVGGAWEVEAPSMRQALRVLEAVAGSGVECRGFSTRVDSLEDVFIRLVGTIEDANGTGPHATGAEA